MSPVLLPARLPHVDDDAPIWRRRTARLWTLVVASTAPPAWALWHVLGAGGFDVLELIGLALFVANMGWVSLSFWPFVAGFVVRTSARRRAQMRTAVAGRNDDDDDDDTRPLRSRTAIVMPIFHEDAAASCARLAALWRTIDARHRHAFELWLLSDSTDDDVIAAEAAAFAALAAVVPGQAFYRRRDDNTGKKSGNIADFVRRFGGRCDFLLVLDADSAMRGARIVSLVRLLENNPGVGIAQTAPVTSGAATLFGRAQQLSSTLMAPLQATGLAYFQRGEANFWGHNALLRVSAFASSSGFQPLPGPPPMGGDILSHDFVEAALLLRAGFSVWLTPDDVDDAARDDARDAARDDEAVGGSWEEGPQDLLAFARRDRRWCQGNLQHAGVFATPGLRASSRVHLVSGMASYVSSLSWLAFLALSTVDAVVHPARRRLDGVHEVLVLVLWPVLLLLLPRALSLLLAWPHRAGFGGGVRLVASVAVELVFASLQAPVTMLLHARFVLATWRGRSVGWGSSSARQLRGAAALSWREAGDVAGFATVIGLAWTVVVALLAPRALPWLSPALLGLVLAVPVARWSSRPQLGAWLRAHGLLATPQETTPPPELQATALVMLAQSPTTAATAATTATTTTTATTATTTATTVPAEQPLAMPLHVLGAAKRPRLEPALTQR